MKKTLLLALVAIFSSLGLAAQANYKTVNGYVVDKNGAPISGAEVTVPGGGETVFTDADGSFTLQVHPLLKKLTARYAGMSNRSLATDFNAPMVFTLKPINPRPGFINVMGGYAIDVQDTGLSYGTVSVMGGQLGKWGYYGKLLSDCGSSYAITIGAIKSIQAYKWYMYFGAGYCSYTEDDWYYTWHNNGVALDLGFICRPSEHFNINFGLNAGTDFDYFSVVGLQVGVGYVF